ncbi:MAG TPA: 2,4-dienoyl-CoA reductase [Candidatus Atribacteria bacterium]|nr:2,4-dienoyl-CoA reductase [Candidatus Atribacteria bacterium]
METNSLFSSVPIGNRTATNRLVINAMEGNDADQNGNPGPKTYRRYRRLFEGDAGVIFLEAITVTCENRARLNQLSILPHNQKALEKFVLDMKKINPQPLFIWQLTHAGELSSPDFSRRVCVKPLPGYGGDLLSEDEIDEAIDQFVLGAKIAHDAGADGVDIKLCHGYLGTQILRPYNDRNWKYGGPWKNRCRFAYEIYERIAKEISDPNFLVGSKVTMWEGIPGGQGCAGPDTACMDLTEPLDLIQGLEERGADFILVSAGNPNLTVALAHPDKRVPDYAYLHHTFQREVKKVVSPKVAVIGSAYSVFRDGKNGFQGVEEGKNTLLYWGDKNIRDGVVDLVAIGRQSFADPLIPAKLKAGKNKEVKWCTLCDNCMELLVRQKNTGCATHDKEYASILTEARQKEGKIKFKYA